MKIYVYVKKAPTSDQLEWAARVRNDGHKVHFQLEKQEYFRKTEECDAYISDAPWVVEAYAGKEIPAFDESMLDDGKKKPAVEKKKAKKKPEPPKNDKADHAANVQKGIDQAAVKNTGGDGVIQEPPPEAA